MDKNSLNLETDKSRDFVLAGEVFRQASQRALSARMCLK